MQKQNNVNLARTWLAPFYMSKTARSWALVKYHCRVNNKPNFNQQKKTIKAKKKKKKKNGTIFPTPFNAPGHLSTVSVLKVVM